MKKIFILTLSLLAVSSLNSCESLLEEKVYSELDPKVILGTAGGIDKVLNSAYANAIASRGNSAFEFLTMSGFTSGECWGIGGTVNAYLTPLANFTWDSNNPYFNSEWNRKYTAIRDANLVLDYINDAQASTEFKATKAGEAKFIRAFSYGNIYKFFGPGPLFTSTFDEEIKKAKASEEEFKNQIVQDLKDAAAALPVIPADYGRGSKGAALGLLTKWYINQKEWELAAQTAKEVMDLNYYQLFPDYRGTFQIQNEGNKEMIFVHSSVANIAGNQTTALTLPTDYPRLPGQTIYAANTFFFDSFLDSFEEGDERKKLFITEYVNTSGKTVPGYGVDKSYPYKYELDPAQASAASGVDIPELRYADILLCRAEALNEIQGPNEESVELINQIRNRSGLGSIALADYTKESLRNRIFQERSWEFFFEGKSREDQIRQGIFISNAKERGKPAQDFHVRFPIPQREMDANSNISQNQGY
ncbi:MAG: RagB/SusD family nutrient uptake outer membrane protein [Cytophagales bacterium]|nr:RagB/SusD family nutrient uptake outer membrane protein [Cytophagales bacterium]